MTDYRISIVKTSEGYLVNHYSKDEYDFLPTFADVVNRLFGYGATTHLAKLHLRDLSPSEELAVKTIRSSVLRINSLEERAKDWVYTIEKLKDKDHRVGFI